MASAPLCMFFLLFACAAAAADGIPQPPSPPGFLRQRSEAFELPGLGFTIPRAALRDPKIKTCWKLLLQKKTCVTALYSMVQGGLADGCIPDMFSIPPPFSSLVPGVIRESCVAYA
ncbi:unnamed protein product [Spirodela intermedia]|uniref:Uncharacterized protein n=1 Tax=Spirodela intermedia TaxID=51605 RepID=A0A7I8IZW1_SPIIN|nr:unnamed protein product [Spirodela intermedia]CAA6663504.1 unnamed protein product [Spirodela intermedia]